MAILSKPLTRRFDVEDEEYGNWSVTFAQATEGAYREIEDTEATFDYVYGEDGRMQSIRRQRNIRRRNMIVCWATMVSAEGFTDEAGIEQFKSRVEGGIQLVKHAMDKTQFAAVWDRLPAKIATKITECAYEVNPDLSPN